MSIANECRVTFPVQHGVFGVDRLAVLSTPWSRRAKSRGGTLGGGSIGTTRRSRSTSRAQPTPRSPIELPRRRQRIPLRGRKCVPLPARVRRHLREQADRLQDRISRKLSRPGLALLNQISAWRTIVGGQPGFFRPRLTSPWASPSGSAGATSFYDVSRLKATLERLVDFDRINSGAEHYRAIAREAAPESRRNRRSSRCARPRAPRLSISSISFIGANL